MTDPTTSEPEDPGRELEELRERDWRTPQALPVAVGILIGVLVLAILAWLLSSFLLS